jgi:hypothetical protein
MLRLMIAAAGIPQLILWVDMLLHLIGWGLMLLAAPTMAQWIPSALDWDKAANEIRRLPPSTFTELPAAVIRELNRRRCTIPQIDGNPVPHNVIKGSFTGKGPIDWAVLCSHAGDSSILVFMGRSIETVWQLSNGPDKNSLQTIGKRIIGYSRMILPANGKSIVKYHREFGGPKPPPIDHQGIEDCFVGKGSVILYYYKGTWLRLTGSD